MAQRTIHMLFGKLISRQIDLSDDNRFLLGNIIPDAYADLGKRNTAHFITKTSDEKYVYFDFYKFREQYGELMRYDDLYLGYYMHLVEDAFYRQFLYNENNFMQKVVTAADVEVLHKDYHLLNSYIIEKYGIENNIKTPEDFEKESLHSITYFAADNFLKELELDFADKSIGRTRFLTEELLDQFVDKYVKYAILECEKVRQGEIYLDPLDYKWKSSNRR